MGAIASPNPAEMSATAHPPDRGEPDAPVRSDTKSSHVSKCTTSAWQMYTNHKMQFSCSNLPEGRDRRLNAQSVREQVQRAPHGGRGTYNNYEQHPVLVEEPMSYWPVNDHGGYKPGDKPGVARAVYNESEKDGRVAVVYHDRTKKGEGKHPPFSPARYVPKRAFTS